MASAIVLSAGIEFLPAQGAQYYPGKNFMAPEYYPASNGIRRLKNVIAGSEYHFMTNGTIWLLNPRLTNFAQDGKVEWTVVSPECTYNINTREVYGNTNMTFRTADEILFLSGVGFLWQQSNAMLILSNQSYTWIDKRALTTNASRYK
ncbi:MAG TPA: hypothetical protein VNT99_18345 [Methylomirabilota bacterium]|nr:hypothetical protein [Methylomirabilota bacterium]